MQGAWQVEGQSVCHGGEPCDRLGVDAWRSGAGTGFNLLDKRWCTSGHFSRSKELMMRPMHRSAQHFNLQSMQ